MLFYNAVKDVAEVNDLILIYYVYLVYFTVEFYFTLLYHPGEEGADPYPCERVIF
jgi:hypothetical protein